MTNQTQIIIFCIIGLVAVPLGTFSAFKLITKLTHNPVNTLHRRADIQLVDYISPTQPQNSLQIDLESGYEGSVSIPYSVNPPSYHWDNIPLYDNGYNIHSILENENMNIYFIIFLITIFLILYLFKKANEHNIKFFNILDWTAILSSALNSSKLNLFSSFDIDFRDSFEWELKSYQDKPVISYLKIQNLTADIINLLNSLKQDVNYSMSLSFISSYEIWINNKDKIDPLFVDNAIIINKESDPFLITQFIMDTLDKKGYFISNWLNKDSSINSIDPFILTVIIPIIVKI